MEISLPPELAESIVKITRERRVDAALLIMVREYLELKMRDVERRIGEYEEKHGMSFEDFREACRSGKMDAYSHEVEEDYREWEALLTLRRYFGELRGRWLTGR